jgi:hypothetical protein
LSLLEHVDILVLRWAGVQAPTWFFPNEIDTPCVIKLHPTGRLFLFLLGSNFGLDRLIYLKGLAFVRIEAAASG